MTKDMTTGSPMKLLLGFIIPTLFGFLFQQCYNIVDTVIVGRFLGVNALAAVGATGSINFLIIGFCVGVCSGFAIPIAQKFGAGDHVGLRKYVANCTWLSIAFALIMTVITTIFCRQILIKMKRILRYMKRELNIQADLNIYSAKMKLITLFRELEIVPILI